MEYMVVWLHDFTDTYYSVHGFDQIDDAEAFYQKLATNNPNIFSCLGKVQGSCERNGRRRQRGLSEKETYSRSRSWKAVCMAVCCSVVAPFIESESSSTLRMPSP